MHPELQQMPNPPRQVWNVLWTGLAGTLTLLLGVLSGIWKWNWKRLVSSVDTKASQKDFDVLAGIVVLKADKHDIDAKHMENMTLLTEIRANQRVSDQKRDQMMESVSVIAQDVAVLKDRAGIPETILNLTLRSVCADSETTGILTAASLLLHTIEPPWRGNRPMISCVPAGEYQLMPYLSPTHGRTWRLHNPLLNIYGGNTYPTGARTEVEIHSGNFASQSEGCILVGLTATTMLENGEDVPAVGASVMALNELRAVLDAPSEEDHRLTIIRDGFYPQASQ